MQAEFQAALEKEQSNTLPVTTFQADDLMEKLKLLNYEKQLLREMKMKPLSRFYFVKSTNPGEQFFMFTSICAWLIRKLGKHFDQPQEFDDPNQTIANIVGVLNEIDIPTDFASNKLIQGAGPICLFVLDCLATQAMKISKVTLSRPQIKPEEEQQVEYMENDAEIILEKVEEEQNAMLSDDSEDEHNSLLDLNVLPGRSNNKTSSFPKAHEFQADNFNEVENWRLELERVLPQLKVVVRADPRDWRAHVKQMVAYKSEIEVSTEDTQNQLRKLQSDITFAMEKIESREKHLNNDLQNLIRQFKDVSIELSNTQAAIKDTEREREDIEKDLSDIIGENETVKSQMEQRGNTMADGSPVINIKKAIAKLKEEIGHTNLEIGLLTHAIDQDIIKQASLYAELETMPTSLG